jgi:hypothetical protein
VQVVHDLRQQVDPSWQGDSEMPANSDDLVARGALAASGDLADVPGAHEQHQPAPARDGKYVTLDDHVRVGSASRKHCAYLAACVYV